MIKWIIEFFKALFAVVSVESKKTGGDPGSAVATFIGEQLPTRGGIKGALAGMAAEIGGATVNEVIAFVSKHQDTIHAMGKAEFENLFEMIFKKGGEFDEEAYKAQVDAMDAEQVVAEMEANADEMAGIATRVAKKKEMTADLKHTLSVLGRFALAKAISIASHGVL